MAMPETRIGLFPDVGAGWYLARAPGAIGCYLAVTGETIGAADALYAGLADVYLDEAAWPALLDSLHTEPFETGADVVARIEREALARGGATDPDKSALAGALEAAQEPAQRDADLAGAEWAARTENLLRELSPLSMAVSLEVVMRSDDSMAECLRRDLDLTRSTFAHGDVMEGIRARIIDKDDRPHWRFARIEVVRVDNVQRMFESPWRSGEHPLAALRG
jgi:enoyl-CoA hydratase/carnithine racemase